MSTICENSNPSHYPEDCPFSVRLSKGTTSYALQVGGYTETLGSEGTLRVTVGHKKNDPLIKALRKHLVLDGEGLSLCDLNQNLNQVDGSTVNSLRVDELIVAEGQEVMDLVNNEEI